MLTLTATVAAGVMVALFGCCNRDYSVPVVLRVVITAATAVLLMRVVAPTCNTLLLTTAGKVAVVALRDALLQPNVVAADMRWLLHTRYWPLLDGAATVAAFVAARRWRLVGALEQPTP